MSPQTPAPPALPTPSPAPQARQLKMFKGLAALLAVALLAGIGAFLYIRHQGQPVAILLDGKPITSVRNAAAADRLLVLAEKAKVGGAFPEDSFVRLQKVQLQIVPTGTALDPDSTAKAKLSNALRLNVHAFAVVVDGHVALGLPTDDAAADTLHLVKEHFAQMPPNADIVGEPTFVQDVVVKPKAVSASLARSSATMAASYFWTPPPSRTYTVHRGDTGLTIARHNHISFSDFIAANSGTDIDRLKPGQSVNVGKVPLVLTVQVKKRITREQKVLANVVASEAGRQQVTYDVTYINGQEIRRDPVNIATLEAPRTRSSL
jgi:hypothetical protein